MKHAIKKLDNKRCTPVTLFTNDSIENYNNDDGGDDGDDDGDKDKNNNNNNEVNDMNNFNYNNVEVEVDSGVTMGNNDVEMPTFLANIILYTEKVPHMLIRRKVKKKKLILIMRKNKKKKKKALILMKFLWNQHNTIKQQQ